jgi:hypothetical protein
MTRKRKAKSDRADPSAAQVAKLAGLSIGRVYRLRQEGRTDGEIIRAARQRKEAFALRDLPPIQVDTVTNGHAAAGAVSYAASLAEKERWAAELRKIEVMEKRRELVPVTYTRLWGSRFLVAARDELLKAPGELRDVLAGESDAVKCGAIIEAWVDRALTKFFELERLWGPPPPEPPAPPPPLSKVEEAA